MRGLLANIGVSQVGTASTHGRALTKLDQESFSHCIFSPNETDLSAAEFVEKVREKCPDLVLLVTSEQATAGNIFDLLKLGVRGFIVRPVHTDALEQTLAEVNRIGNIPKVILEAEDRNEALSEMIAGALDEFVKLLRQARKFESAKHSIPDALKRLRSVVALGRQFCDGGEEKLQEALIERFEKAVKDDEPKSRRERVRLRMPPFRDS